MKQHYMTYPERVRLETMLRFKVPVARIARELGCCRQTIYNEIKRGQYVHTAKYKDELRYSAEKGQSIQDQGKRHKGRRTKIADAPEYKRFLEERLIGMQPNGKIVKKRRCSPAVALELARRKGFTMTVCVSTLYNYIYRGRMGRAKACDLWEAPYHRARGQGRRTRIAHPQFPSIEQRPQHINERQEPGNWEMDLIIGKEQKGALLTLTERVTRQEIIRKLPNKKSASVITALDQIERSTPDFREKFRSITTDNGPEFLNYDGLRHSIQEGTRCQVYYCHSFASWEKGTNERSNRMIRRWFPKGTDFTKVTEEQVQQAEDWINNYPRKALGWYTPAELAEAVRGVPAPAEPESGDPSR